MEGFTELAAREVQKDLEISQEWEHDDILLHIEQRVADMLDKHTDLLMSYLYRLDVLEYKINHVMKHAPADGIAKELAMLIWQRQIERAKTKLHFKTNSTDADPC